MLYVNLPDALTVRKLSFYLAMEEYVARRIVEDDVFFMWQVEPSVIFGRNQSMEQEVNLDFCRQHHIQVYRRKSGGGCVYADEDNLMLSYITRGEQVGLAFHRFVSMLLLVLRKMGVEAVGTAHNDVLIAGRKVSGTACYHLLGKSIVHGTLLYDTNMDYMLGAITPGEEKLQKKGIQSVRQRVTLLKDYVSLSLGEVRTLIRQTLCCGELTLSAADISAIEQIEQGYLQSEFLHLL